MKKITTIIRFVVSGMLLSICLIVMAQPILVSNTLDAGPGSLRDAITIANNRLGHDIINFNITTPPPHIISPLSQLPPLMDPAGATIDGFSQPGASAGGNPPSTTAILIELNGALMPGPPAPPPYFTGHGLWLVSPENIVRGLAIYLFQNDGIRIEGGFIDNQPAFNNHIFANFIGTDVSGSQVGFGNGTNQPGGLWAGVKIQNNASHGDVAADNVVEANVISNNWAEGVWIQGPFQIPGDPPDDVGYNFVLDNHVGVDIGGGTDLGNVRVGVELSEGTHDNTIQGNVISGNGWDGVGIQGFNNVPFLAPAIYTQFNWVDNNIIGMDIGASVAIPNDNHGVAIGIYGPTGICWGYAYDNQITNNVIAYNGRPGTIIGDGVAICEDHTDEAGTAPFNNTDENTISQNSIYQNAHLGIDLDDNDGVTPNDPSDPDNSSNENMNFPVISSVNTVGGNTVISGTIDLPPTAATCVIEVFESDSDLSQHGEGMVFLGATTLNIPPSVFPHPWSVTIPLSVAPEISATATDNQGNTSEFAFNAPNIVIPLQLLYFEAEAVEDHIRISWQTENEIDVDEYLLERGETPDQFNTIHKTIASGELIRTSYQYQDKEAKPGQLYYYRVKVIGNQGSNWFSPIKSARIEASQLLKIYPNPTADVFYLYLSEPEDSDVRVHIFKSTGQCIFSNSFKGISVGNPARIDLYQMPPGFYYVEVETTKNNYFQKLLLATK